MAAIIIKPKDRNEWLAEREKGIGSSEVATIVGLNPYETPYKLWRRKMGLEPRQTETFAMTAGHYLEDAVTMFWQDATGREVIKSSAGDWLFVNPEKEWMRASPDRTFWLDEKRSQNNKGILECKTTQANIDADDLPKHWFCQLQWQMGIGEFNQGSLAWLCAGREFGYKDATLVQDFFGWLSEEAERFWIDNIKGQKEPDLINVADILSKYSKHVPDKIAEVNEELYQSYIDIKDIRAQISQLEKRKEELEESLKLAFKDAEALSYCGNTIATWKASKDVERFDAKTFRQEHPALCQPYIQTEPGSRRFLLK